MTRLLAFVMTASISTASAYAQAPTRPLRIVLIVDSTESIRQPIGMIRKALGEFVQDIDARHEMMLVTLAGTPQIRVRPTGDRALILRSVNGIFGTTGANVMQRMIDDLFHRFAQPADRTPIFVVVTTEGFESTQHVNPQELAHVANHFVEHGGTLHAVRLVMPTGTSTFRDGNLMELPVSLMIARDTQGVHTNISPNGLNVVLQRLATVINEAP